MTSIRKENAAAKDPWKPWNDEKKYFSSRRTKGHRQDLEALHRHIENLIEVAPKDSAGYPVLSTIEHIHHLRELYLHYLERLKENQQ